LRIVSVFQDRYPREQRSRIMHRLHYVIRQQMQKKLEGIKHGSIMITDAWGSWCLGDGVENTVNITIHDSMFYWLVFRNGSNGAADAYRKAYWDCSSLNKLFAILINNTDKLDAMESGLAKLGVIQVIS